MTDIQMREFEVGESCINGKYNKCLVCEKKFKLKEKIVLVPIQGVKKGFGNVMCILIHKDCYWIEEEGK